MTKVKNGLHRRTDLSTLLVHLTRDHGKTTARESLLSIAKTSTIYWAPRDAGTSDTRVKVHPQQDRDAGGPG